MRITSIILVSIVGAGLGLGGAAFFNLAGLIWVGGSFEKAMYWEPLESAITVSFGCASLLGWVSSLIAVLIMSRAGVSPGDRIKMKRTSYTAVGISCAVVVAGLIVALAVLPAQYEWVKY
ncbi:hypothetical protein [Microbacterium sp. NPDC057944]|uniref:hypothetical protein n=1 Tax=Microbacterium sp. NPDC057944 TaxID=3346286 RepID=UPI0036D7FBF4